MQWFRSRNLLDETFAIAIILKGLDGLLEVGGGLLFLVLTPATINNVVRAITQHELSQDPHDVVFTHLLHYTTNLSSSTLRFGAVYLLLHGVVKVILVTALLRNQLWAYPWLIIFLVAFIVYQLYRMTFAPGLGLAALTIFDAFVVWLTYREYQKQRRLRLLRYA